MFIMFFFFSIIYGQSETIFQQNNWDSRGPHNPGIVYIYIVFFSDMLTMCEFCEFQYYKENVVSDCIK